MINDDFCFAFDAIEIKLSIMLLYTNILSTLERTQFKKKKYMRETLGVDTVQGCD